MFERTVDIVHGNPLAIVPLLALCWFVGRGVLRRKGVAYRVLRKSLKLGVVPLVVLFVLAEATGRPEPGRLARWLFEAEAWIAGRALDAMDGVIAALLRSFLGLVDAVLRETFGAVASAVPSWNPFAAVSTAGFLLSMFVVHFLAGAAVVWVARKSAITSSTDGWLTAVGGVLFVSGIAWTLLQLDAFDLDRTALSLAVLVTSVGVTSGVVATSSRRGERERL